MATAKASSTTVKTLKTPDGLVTREVMERETWLITGYDTKGNFPMRAVTGRHKAIEQARIMAGSPNFVDSYTRNLIEGCPVVVPATGRSGTSHEWQLPGQAVVQIQRILGPSERDDARSPTK